MNTATGTQRGVVFDRRGGANDFGQIIVESPVDRGIFAYTAAPVLLNKARLGATASYTPSVFKVTSDSRYASAGASAIEPTSCALSGNHIVIT